MASASPLLWKVLTTGHHLPLYALADGAANAYIYAHLHAHNVPHLALFKDKSLPAEQSPWLFQLNRQEPFSEWYLQQSPSQNWGILLAAPLPLSRLADHLKSFITMQDEQGKLHLIRFYDPRVIKAYLDALSAEQRQGFFKPGLHLWADAPGQPETLHYYRQDQNHTSRKAIDLHPNAPADTKGARAC